MLRETSQPRHALPLLSELVQRIGVDPFDAAIAVAALGAEGLGRVARLLGTPRLAATVLGLLAKLVREADVGAVRAALGAEGVGRVARLLGTPRLAPRALELLARLAHGPDPHVIRAALGVEGLGRVVDVLRSTDPRQAEDAFSLLTALAQQLEGHFAVRETLGGHGLAWTVAALERPRLAASALGLLQILATDRHSAVAVGAALGPDGVRRVVGASKSTDPRQAEDAFELLGNLIQWREGSAGAVRAALGPEGLRWVVVAMEMFDGATHLFNQLARDDVAHQEVRAALVDHVLARTRAALDTPRLISDALHLYGFLAATESACDPPGAAAVRAALQAGLGAGGLGLVAAAVHTPESMEARRLLQHLNRQAADAVDPVVCSAAIYAALDEQGLSWLKDAFKIAAGQRLDGQ